MAQIHPTAIPSAKNQSADVTVIAVCYNHERFVTECLESIKAQSHQNFELIVVDDRSTDNSPELIAAWMEANYPQGKYLRHKENIGLCKSINEALAISSGKYVNLIATDDVWLPHKIERQLAAIKLLPETTAVLYSDAMQMDEMGTTLHQSFLEAHLPAKHPPSGKIFPALADGNFVPAMAAIIRRDAITKIGGYDEELSYEDYDMWLRLADVYDFEYLPDVVARYRIVSTSMIRTLWEHPTPKHSFSIFTIHKKWIHSPKLTQAQRAQWANKISTAAYSLYVHGDARAPKCLWTAFFLLPSTRTLALAASSSIGISRSVAKKIASLAGNSD